MFTKIKIFLLETKPLASNILFIGSFLIIFIFLLVLGFTGEGTQQFSLLAQSFLHGHTYFMKSIGGAGYDPVIYKGKQYWDDGFFPSIVLLPFVAFFNLFHIFFYQGYLKWLIVLGTFYLIYRIGLHLKYSKKDSLIFSFAFMLSTVYIGVNTVSSGWLFAQIVATFLLFWALYEYFTKKRWLLLGFICGILFLTRIPAAAIIIFFGLEIIFSKMKSKAKIINLLKLGLFGLIAVLILGGYNYIRFGNPLNNGNSYQLISNYSLQARNMGLISLDHFPTNFYSFLLRGPKVVLRSSTSWSLTSPYIINSNLGEGIIFTSPFLFYLLTKRWSNYSKEMRFMLVGVLVSFIMLMLYYGVGANQFGYRYSLDFLPEVFVVFMVIYRKFNKKLTTGMKTLFLITALFNFYLVLSYIGFLS